MGPLWGPLGPVWAPVSCVGPHWASAIGLCCHGRCVLSWLGALPMAGTVSRGVPWVQMIAERLRTLKWRHGMGIIPIPIADGTARPIGLASWVTNPSRGPVPAGPHPIPTQPPLRCAVQALETLLDVCPKPVHVHDLICVYYVYYYGHMGDIGDYYGYWG